MIKKISLAIAAVCALCSCNEKESVSNSMEGQVTTIDFSVPGAMTKSAALFNEDAVNSLQVFVFDLSGKIDASGVANGRSLKLTCTTGEKEIFALVNSPERKGIRTKSDLLAVRTDLAENSSTGLVMEGYKRATLTSNASVTIPVFRNAACVTLKSVTSAFELDVHKNLEFKVTKVSLINVAGNKKYTGNIADADVIRDYTVAPTLWYNKMGVGNSPLEMLSDDVLNGVVASGTSYKTEHYFYCYPNPITLDSSAGTWSDRYTRLVVSTTLGGVVYHYPVSIPAIKPNTRYDVTLTVTRPGSTSEDVPVHKLDATVSIDVRPWTSAPAVNEVI